MTNMRPGGKDKASKSTAAGNSQDIAGEGDSDSTPIWVWGLAGVLAAAIVGGIVAAVVMSQRKKNQPQLVPYAAPAQVYDPNQALFGQQGQPRQPTPQLYLPGYAEPATQSYQQPYNGQPGQFGQPDQGR